MKESMLLKIQKTVSQYAHIIAHVTQVQVEIMDCHLVRVAGTGSYSKEIGKDVSAEGHVYEHILKTGRSLVIEHPGMDEICTTCQSKDHCQEFLSISAPVIVSGKAEGVIGLVAVSQREHDILVRQLDIYLKFIEQIADFISTKIKEYKKEEKNKAQMATLTRILDNIEQSVIILDQNSRIKDINLSTCVHLNVTKDIIGKKLKIRETGDDFHGASEYSILIDDKEYFVVGEILNWDNDTSGPVKILIFRDQKQFKNTLYDYSSEVRALDNIVGSSDVTMKLKRNINRVAKSMSTVLITGESGTGKELVATAIWKASARKKEKFVPINCAAIPDALLESELFGYVKGAFTGADPNGRMGKFELANHGVIFLDEIGDMPIYLQAKLLRVLQEQEITRIGSNHQIKIDVRVIAATNKDLPELIRQNKFREDLYYRLNVIPLRLPSLRERREDIWDLSLFFAEKYAERFNKKFVKITESVRQHLYLYPWTGNIRELENTIEFMLNMMDEDGILDVDTLPDNLLQSFEEQHHTIPVSAPVMLETGTASIVPLEELEQQAIQNAISLCGDTTEGKKMAAKKLGIAVSTLYRKLEKLEKS